MNNKPLISVIVPVYNVQPYLKKCVNSIIKQTYSNLEIILVDDGSLDLSPQICDDYVKIDRRIRVIHKKNGGLSDARNAGLEIASGQYIGFVDSDDYIEKDMYELLLNSIEKNNVDIAICGRTMVRENGSLIGVNNVINNETVFAPETAIARLLTWDNCDSAAWDKLYRRKLFSDICYPKGKLHEDLNVTCRLFSRSRGIVQIPVAKYNYLVRDDSICRQPFCERRFDLYYQAAGNRDFVSNKYPSLNKEADYFVWHCTLGVLSSLVDSECKNMEFYKKVNELIALEKKTLIFNPFVKKQEKIIYLKKRIKYHFQAIKMKVLSGRSLSNLLRKGE